MSFCCMFVFSILGVYTMFVVLPPGNRSPAGSATNTGSQRVLPSVVTLHAASSRFAAEFGCFRQIRAPPLTASESRRFTGDQHYQKFVVQHHTPFRVGRKLITCLFPRVSVCHSAAPGNVAPQLHNSMLQVQTHMRRVELDSLLRKRVDIQSAIDSYPLPQSPAHRPLSSHQVSFGSSAAVLAAPLLSSSEQPFPPDHGIDAQRTAAAVFGPRSSTLRRLSRNRRESTLSDFLEHRPNIQQLQTRRVIFEDTMVWTRELPSGAIPSPRNCHSITAVRVAGGGSGGGVGDEISPVVYLFGGFGTERSNELLMFDARTMHWTRPVVAGALPIERFANVPQPNSCLCCIPHFHHISLFSFHLACSQVFSHHVLRRQPARHAVAIWRLFKLGRVAE
jgi:hypothetical protein